jgi:hypothetical protein
MQMNLNEQIICYLDDKDRVIGMKIDGKYSAVIYPITREEALKTVNRYWSGRKAEFVIGRLA